LPSGPVGGHAVATIPGVPFGPKDAVNAYSAENDGLIATAAILAVSAYELVDGIPNGKNVLTNNFLLFKYY